jgi:hypothetical protein
MEDVLRQAKNGAVYSAVAESLSQTPGRGGGQARERLSASSLLPGMAEAVCYEVKTPMKSARPPPPESENTIKGAKDAFTETVRTNTSLAAPSPARAGAALRGVHHRHGNAHERGHVLSRGAHGRGAD